MRAVLLSLSVVILLAVPVRAVEQEAINAAIDRGVAGLKKMQRNGIWSHDEMGATSLCALTLLECGVDKDDQAITGAATAIRNAALSTTHTYSLSLHILFLERLDKAEDTPLIEAMLVNLMAGQNVQGGWGYKCPKAFTQEEIKALTEEGGGRVLKGARDLAKLPEKGKRTTEDLPPVIKAKLEQLGKMRPGAAADTGIGDNSNTQFANLALWVGRRFGVPTGAALLRIDARYRATQNPDGGWSYSSNTNSAGPGAGLAGATNGDGSTASMTCAGLLGLACGHGVRAGVKREKDKDDKITVDISKDDRLKLGLQALSSAVGNPVGWKGTGKPPAAVGPASGKAFYYLWSLERVCVGMNLSTLARKDWYNWGAEILLANQGQDGTWVGEYTQGGCDTCFALMFLKKVNLARDLSGSIRGKDVGARALKSGGVGGGALKTAGDKPLASDIGAKPERDKDKKDDKGEKGKTDTKTVEKTKPRSVEEETAARLSRDLVRSKGLTRESLLKALRDSKGSAYTEALAGVIPNLDADTKKLAREALSDRLTRMKAATLREYFKETDPEIRCAAALAAAQKDARVLVPDLIDLLDDKESLVQRGARAALKALAGKDLGADPGPWREWWKTQAKE